VHCGHSVGLSAHPRKIEPEQVAVICVYDAAGNVIETHEDKGDFETGEVFTRIASHFSLQRVFGGGTYA